MLRCLFNLLIELINAAIVRAALNPYPRAEAYAEADREPNGYQSDRQNYRYHSNNDASAAQARRLRVVCSRALKREHCQQNARECARQHAEENRHCAEHCAFVQNSL